MGFNIGVEQQQHGQLELPGGAGTFEVEQQRHGGLELPVSASARSVVASWRTAVNAGAYAVSGSSKNSADAGVREEGGVGVCRSMVRRGDMVRKGRGRGKEGEYGTKGWGWGEIELKSNTHRK